MNIYRVRNKEGDERKVQEDFIQEAAKDGYYPVVQRGADIRTAPFENLKDASQDGYNPIIENQKSAEPPRFAEEAPARAWGELGQAFGTVLKPFGEISETIDRYVGAPIRAGIGKTIEEREEYEKKGGVAPFFSTEALSAAAQQFGEDPRKAPTYSQLAGKYGVSKEKTIPSPYLKGFGTPQARFEFGEKISPADIAGTAVGALADPSDIVIGKTLGYAGKALRGGVSSLNKNILHGSILQTRPEIYEAYKARFPQLMNRVYNPDDLKNLGADVFETVDAQKQKLSGLEVEARSLDENLKNIRNQAQTSFKPSRISSQVDPVEMSKTVNVLIKKDLAKLREMGAEADNILRDLNITAPKRDLKNILLKASEEISPINPFWKAQQQKLIDVANTVDTAYGPYLSGPQLREYVQGLDEMINWRPALGAKEEPFQAKLKQVRGRIQESLKNTAETSSNMPGDYRKKIDEMFKLIDAKNSVQHYFSDPETSLGTIKRLMDPNNIAENKIIIDRIKNYADLSQNSQLSEIMDELQNISAQFDEFNLDRDKFLKENDPQYRETSDKKTDLELQIQGQKDRLKSVKNITSEGRAEDMLKNVGMFHGGKTDYINQIKAAEDLAAEGSKNADYIDQAKDIGILADFEKERAPTGFLSGAVGMGSTAVGLGAGSAVGSPFLGAAVGGMLGPGISSGLIKKGGKISRALLNKQFGAQQALKTAREKFLNPRGSFAPYANMLKNTLKVTEQSFPVYHQLLYNTDENYRNALSEE
jgi:hypothetical protein